MYYLAMAEDPVEHREERDMSDAELAQAYLTRETEETNKSIADNQSQEKFYTTYKGPTHPGTSPNSDAGMDIADWNASRLEYEQWPEEREETLERIAGEQEALYEKRADLEDLGTRMERGDPNTVALLAGREKARREAIAEQERTRRVQKEGVAFEGVDEVINQIQELGQATWKKDPSGHWDSLLPTPNGWRKYYDSENGYTYAFGEADLGNPKISMQIGRGHAWEQDSAKSQHLVRVRYNDLSDMKAERHTGARLGFKVDKPGLGLHFEIDTNRKVVLNHSAGDMKPGFMNSNDPKAKSVGVYRPMTQEHFNGFKSNLNSLVQGVKMAPSA